MGKNKFTVFILLTLVLILVILTGACSQATPAPTSTPASTPTAAPAPAPAPAKVIEIRISGGMPPGHPVSASILRWKDKVEAGTNGRVKVTFYEGNTLGQTTEFYEMVLNGVVEAAHTAEFWAGGRFPLVEGLNLLPFNIQNLGDIYAVDSALYEAGLLKELEPFKLNYFTPVAALSFFTQFKINTMEDLKGKTLRASGIQGEVIKLMGATPVNAPGSEEYMMLQTKVLNGNITGADNAYARKLYEVVSYAN